MTDFDPGAAPSMEFDPGPPAAVDERGEGLPMLLSVEICEMLRQRVGDEIVKTFELPTFPDAIAFVGRIAERAEAADHHPDLDIRYRKVRVALSTHDAGGLTELDFDLAAEIEGCLT